MSSFRAAQILLKVGELSRRVRSWPFDTLIGAFCPTFRALSDAPISVANGHDLTLLPSSPTFEQKVCSPEIAQFGKHNIQFLYTRFLTLYTMCLTLYMRCLTSYIRFRGVDLAKNLIYRLYKVKSLGWGKVSAPRPPLNLVAD